jgi:polyisoprenoid-binding protein YceI
MTRRQTFGLGKPAHAGALAARAIPAVFAVAWTVAWTAPAAADTWSFDKAHTEIRFSWDHLGLSRKSGRFLDMDGTLEFNPSRSHRGAHPHC